MPAYTLTVNNTGNQQVQCSLSNLNRVCQSLRIPARFVLYQHVHIASPKSLHKLGRTLRRNPHLASLVESLSVICLSDHVHKDWWSRLPGRLGRRLVHKWEYNKHASNARFVQAMLEIMPSLQLLHIEERNLSWSIGNSSLYREVVHTASVERITNWTLVGTSVAPTWDTSTPSVFGQVKTLVLREMPSFGTIYAAFPNLRHLTVERTYLSNWVPLLTLFLSCLRLESLMMSHNTYDPISVDEKLESLSGWLYPHCNTLRKLALLGDSEWIMFKEANWASFSRLESVVVGAYCLDSLDEDGVLDEADWPDCSKLGMPSSLQQLTVSTISSDPEESFQTRFFSRRARVIDTDTMLCNGQWELETLEMSTAMFIRNVCQATADG